MTVPGKGLIDEPQSDVARQSRAGECVKGLGLDRYLAVVDGLDDAVSRTWEAWPDRLAVIGRDGTVVFHGEPGPRGFSPDQAEKALKDELAKPVPVRPASRTAPKSQP